MEHQDGLYARAVSKFGPTFHPWDQDPALTQRAQDYHFAMQCNGYFQEEDGQWMHSAAAVNVF